ncbi:hypothetical protein AVEN_113407-1 [Araneus ventricosus]|uniref:Reverse transcriptase/retrotransposon-derived protein RNase H-like domain-containing protein n=1 Tax=Araneus ventricosus TaxID=182803 RepID=A0A4Y2I253_ARAVE|nr:hypothetical protein AVEN_113407-1 [Araneus ventricosus]
MTFGLEMQRSLFKGFEASFGGVPPLPDKIKVLTEYPLPKKVENLRRTLAMLNFCQRLFKNAAGTQARLHDLVKCKVKRDKTAITWTEESREAFQTCKELLTNATMLVYPKLNTPLSLVTDASETTIGAVLQQHVEEVLPTVLLGIRACFKEDSGVSPEEMVFDQGLCFPGEFFRKRTSQSQGLTEENFLQRLRLYIRKLRPEPTSHHSLTDFLCTQIFVQFCTSRYNPETVGATGNDIFLPSALAGVKLQLDRLKPAYVQPENHACGECQKDSKPAFTRSGRRILLTEPHQASYSVLWIRGGGPPVPTERALYFASAL